MDTLRKTSWSRLVLLLSIAVFGSMLLVACSEDEAAETDPLKIGYLADFSGPLAEFGPAIQTGVELALKHINDAGGVHGQPVQFVTGDDKTDQTAAV